MNDARSSPGGVRARRLRAPLLLVVWALLAIEAAGGLVIFTMRLVAGTAPGTTLHVIAGLALLLAWSVYQWNHWRRVAPWRSRLHYALGLVAGLAMALALATGVALGWPWWRARDAPAYPAWLSGAHNVMSMLVLTFVGAHLLAVLQREPGRGGAREPRR